MAFYRLSLVSRFSRPFRSVLVLRVIRECYFRDVTKSNNPTQFLTTFIVEVEALDEV